MNLRRLWKPDSGRWGSAPRDLATNCAWAQGFIRLVYSPRENSPRAMHEVRYELIP
jgi:hypothetical protein